MAGYSGTPLPKKLGIKQQFRVAFLDLPADVKAELASALANCNVGKDGPLDFAMIFVKSAAELKKQFPRFAKASGARRHAVGELAEEGFRSGY